jgi:hypothetical protein
MMQARELTFSKSVHETVSRQRRPARFSPVSAGQHCIPWLLPKTKGKQYRKESAR